MANAPVYEAIEQIHDWHKYCQLPFKKLSFFNLIPEKLTHLQSSTP